MPSRGVKARDHAATIELPGDVATEVMAILLDASNLPRWNPAIWDVREVAGDVRSASGTGDANRASGTRDTNSASAAGGRFSARSRIGPARLTVRRVSESEVETCISTPLVTERSSWVVTRRGTALTTVTHTITLGGLGAWALGRAFSTVPRMRLERLSAQVTGAAPGAH